MLMDVYRLQQEAIAQDHGSLDDAEAVLNLAVRLSFGRGIGYVEHAQPLSVLPPRRW